MVRKKLILQLFPGFDQLAGIAKVHINFWLFNFNH